ncbi:MAG: efflux RND transporter periplasmic adaptor subunit [Myxococcota bacterium]
MHEARIGAHCLHVAVFLSAGRRHFGLHTGSGRHDDPGGGADRTADRNGGGGSRRLSGDVQPWEVLPLSFKVGGRVARILVEEGEQVKAGQPVAYLDARDYVLARDLARAQIDAIQPHLDRAERLHAADALPNAIDEVAGKMKVAEVQREQANSQLAYAALHAPIEGVVVRRTASPGQMAGPTAPVVVIAALDPVKVSLPVAQRDLPLFQTGDTVALSAVGHAQPIEGTVHSIGGRRDPGDPLPARSRVWAQGVEGGRSRCGRDRGRSERGWAFRRSVTCWSRSGS